MNIFKDHKHILGFFEPKIPKTSLQDIFKRAKEIRIKLGKQGYLLDSYLSFLLDAANSMLAFDASNAGFEAGSKLRMICADVLEDKKTYADHPFYDTVKKDFENHPHACQEIPTLMSMRYISLADTYLKYALPAFYKEQERILENEVDTIKMNNLYEKIVLCIGEAEMQQLNQDIKERFFSVTVISAFLQGFTNDLVYCLITRDFETDRKGFQLLMEQL